MEFEYNGHKIRAISIKQPWANLIVMGKKDIVNRSWKMKINEDICKNWLLVHASTKYEIMKEVRIEIKEEIEKYECKKFPRSAIIGLMHINRIEERKIKERNNIWAIGSKYWHIDAVLNFKNPIYVKGNINFWNPEEKIHNKLKQEIKTSINDAKFYYEKLSYRFIKNKNYKMEKFFQTYNFQEGFVNLIIGDRDWKNKKLIKRYIELLPKNTIIVTRNARGAEKILIENIDVNIRNLTIYKANWKKNGLLADNIRNKEIYSQVKPDLVTVFYVEGKGTEEILKQIKKEKIQILKIIDKF
jgi:hypothetical protein